LGYFQLWWVTLAVHAHLPCLVVFQVKAVMMKDELLARGRPAADINEGIIVPLDNLFLLTWWR
jgi:hypothetical protein